MPSATSLVPLEWPESWHEASLVRLLRGSPLNCVLLPAGAPAAVEQALRADFTVFREPPWRRHAEIDWRRAGEIVWIGDAVWPSVGASSDDTAEAGPTGLPWLESNGWLIRMARDLVPQSAVWIRSSPPEDAARMDAGLFVLAQCEAWAHGARRPLWVPPPVAAGLARGNASALAWWQRLTSIIGWWARHVETTKWPTAARLLVISDFAGGNADHATEFLNLAARRNLPWRASLPDGAAAPGVERPRLSMSTSSRSKEALLDGLTRFVRSGGLLLCLQAGCPPRCRGSSPPPTVIRALRSSGWAAGASR